jgi:putative ABC transport system ATP-binding protein
VAAIIELHAVRKSYPMGVLSIDALKNINLTIEAGDFVAIAGPSGSGKSTMMNIIGLIDKPTEGSVLIGGRETKNLPRR